eukprot:Skav206267  [mRNA]  locus=scaffold8121:279:8933:- [translate_table: standard]
MRGRLPRAMGTAPDENDIFALVKSTMASKELCQDPLLVWPASLEPAVRDAFQGVDDPGCPTQCCELDDPRRQELRALRMAFQRDFPQLHRVAAWYDTMLNGDGSGERPAPLTFLREARAHRVDWADFQLGQRAPGPRPHELQVVAQKNLGQHLQDVFGGGDRLERVRSSSGVVSNTRSAGKTKDEDEPKHPVKKDEMGDSDSDSDAGGKDRDPDDVDVRDVRYKLENLEFGEGNDCICGTMNLDSSGSDIVTLVGNKLYEGCRAGRLQIPNFPQFDPLLNALKAGYTTEKEQAFRVTMQKADSLLILESLASKWVDSEFTSEKAKEIIEAHNAEYNASQEFWLTPAAAAEDGGADAERPAKRLKEGKELLDDDAFSRYFNFAVCNTSLILLEKKDLPEHVQKIDNLDTVVTLQSLMNDLEDCGEAMGLGHDITSKHALNISKDFVLSYFFFPTCQRFLPPQVKLEVSHHASNNGDWKQTKPLVFVLDNIPDPEKDKKIKKEKEEKPRKKQKKQKKDELTSRNFGSYLDIGKTKNAKHICLAWRCRLLGYA